MPFATSLSRHILKVRFETEFDQVSAMIAPYVERDPTKFCTYDEFETGVSTLKASASFGPRVFEASWMGTIPSTTDGQQADDSAGRCFFPVHF